MSAIRARLPAAGGRLGPVLRHFGSGITAVGVKELRGRMRGRRAFVVLTLYLLLLCVFAWGIYQLQRQINDAGFGFGSGVPVSATVGHAIFSGLLVLETLLVLVLAPALTSGAVSLEREKQTLDLLVATPLSTLAMVVGKLLSALTYVFLLILASIPVTSIVFTFGGVGPEDVVRAYAYLFAVAFGTGAIALFYSALLRRTQAATVVSYLTVLAVTLGATVLYGFWFTMAQDTRGADRFDQARVLERRPPEALLWLNPFVADLDLVCGTSPAGFDPSCVAVGGVTGAPFLQQMVAGPDPAVVRTECGANGCIDRPMAGPGAFPPEQVGFARDLFWPRSALAFLAVGVLLTLLSSQLVSATRTIRLRRSRGVDRRPPAADPV